MTKDVLVTIRGTQFIPGHERQDEVIEIVTTGTYYKKNGKHYLFYDEVIDEIQGTVKNTVKISERFVEIWKKGVTSTQMLFEMGKKTTSMYGTPYGEIEIGICAEHIQFVESEDSIVLELNYELEMNSQFVSDSQIHMEIAPVQC
ncbi:MAG: DUF1934 domain-containing protein [Lachnospiraceae bacterium]